MSVLHFNRLSVQGYRRLSSVDIPLRPLTVMIGANGVGKSSLIEVLWLLANSANGRLAEALNNRGGLGSVLTYDRAESLKAELSSSAGMHYSITFRPQGYGYIVDREILTSSLGLLPHIDSQGAQIRYLPPEISSQFNYQETSLAQVSRASIPAEEFRRQLASFTSYHTLHVEPRSPVRLPQTMQPSLLPGSNGEELVSCLFNMRETQRDRFDAVEDALRVAFPRFSRLEFPPVAAGTIALAWRESGFSRPLYMNQLSEGTLRFLWLATLLQSPGLGALTLIDEPEVSLHPELLSILAELLREVSSRSQIVVATHSDRLIRFLQPDEVLLFDTDDNGMATTRWADELNLDDWLEDYTLDELWSKGRLGARA